MIIGNCTLLVRYMEELAEIMKKHILCRYHEDANFSHKVF